MILKMNQNQKIYSSIDYAAYYGNLDEVKRLHHNGESCTTQAMNWAASNGYLRVVEWLHDNRDEGCTTLAMDGAASNGHLDVVEFLHDNRYEGCTYYGYSRTAENGDLNMIKLLNKYRSEENIKKAMEMAASEGTTNIVEWLFENGCEGYSVEKYKKYIKDLYWTAIFWTKMNITRKCPKYKDVFEYLDQIKIKYRLDTNQAIEKAVLEGNIYEVEWLFENEFNGYRSTDYMKDLCRRIRSWATRPSRHSDVLYYVDQIEYKYNKYTI